jgi:hypothetical protein
MSQIEDDVKALRFIKPVVMEQGVVCVKADMVILHRVLDRLEGLERREFELRTELALRHNTQKMLVGALSGIGCNGMCDKRGYGNIECSNCSIARAALEKAKEIK